MKKILIFLLIIVIGVGITGCVFSTKNNILKKIELEGLNCKLQKRLIHIEVFLAINLIL